MPQRILSTFLLALALTTLSGCAVWGVYDDKRLSDTMTEDKALASSIKSALMKEKLADGWSVSVYSYYRHVFLVGEVPGSMQGKAVEIAKSKKPSAVTTHWFTKSKNESSDIGLATKLRGTLIGTRGLSSTRIDTEVNAGRVVLLGVVENEQEKNTAVAAAKKVQGVTQVFSYLMLPPGHGVLKPERTKTAPATKASAPSESRKSGGIESRDL